MQFRKPKPLSKRYKPDDRIMVYDHAMKRWDSATVIRYEPRAEGRYELLYVIRDGEKYEEGHIPDEEEFQDGGAQLPLFNL
jgi:hypothetical protein